MGYTYTRGRPDVAVDDVTSGSNPVDTVSVLGNDVPGALVGGGTATVKETGTSREDGTGADGDEIPDVGVHLGNPLINEHHLGVTSSSSTGDQENLKIEVVLDGSRADNGRLEDGASGVVAGRLDNDGVGSRGDDGDVQEVLGGNEVEDLERAENVDHVDTGHGQHTPVDRDCFTC